MFSFLISKVGQGKINLLSTLIVLGASTLINFLLTPFFIEHLELDGLGIVRIALSIPMYVGLVSLALMAAFSRFLVVEINSNNIPEANKVFNTSIILVLALFLFTIPVVTIVIFHLGSDTESVYLYMYIYAFITTLAVSLTFPAYAINRQELYNTNKLIALVFQTLFIFVLFNIDANIDFVGIAFILGSIISFIYSLLIFKKISCGLHLRAKDFCFKTLKKILNVSKWTFIDNSGMLLLLTVDLILISYFIDKNATGEYSIFIQILTALLAVSKSVGGVFGPKIYAIYSEKNYDDIRNIVTKSIILIGAPLSIVVPILSVFSDKVLTLWLGESHSYLSTFIFWGLILLPIILSTSSFSYVFTAFIKVRTPAIVTLITGFLHILTVLVISLLFGFNIWFYMASLISFLFIRNIIFNIIYFKIISKISISKLVKSIIFLSLLSTTTIILSNMIKDYINNTGNLLNLPIAITIVLLLSFITYRNKNEIIS